MQLAPLITIGMPTYDDHEGVWATFQSLRLHNDTQGVELLVVDNNPTGKHAHDNRRLCEDANGHGNHSARYVEMDEQHGNAQAKNRVVTEATAPWVLVLDCHILMPVSTVAMLKKHARDYGDSPDLFHGPAITQGQFSPQTHWTDRWHRGSWGGWGRDRRCTSADAPAFEVDEGMGGGLFFVRRDKWLGFNPRFRGFGGESMYLQNKYRHHSRKVWCLNWLRWLHRYPRPNGIPFPYSKHDQYRNIILGMLELGQNDKLEQMRQHLVEESAILTADEWGELAELAAIMQGPRV